MSAHDFYPPGASWGWRGTITNSAGNTGAHTYDFTPGQGTEFELIGGYLLNTAGATETINVYIRETNRVFMYLVPVAASVADGQLRSFPTPEVSADNGPVGAPGPLRVSGTAFLQVVTSSIAISQDTSVGLWARIFGQPPTVTMTGGTGATTDEQVNQVY